MIEHKAWPGPNRKVGVGGQRIAVVGYSHHRNEGDEDTDNFTIGVVRNMLCGRKGDSFFPRIPGYFGFEDRSDFWKRVLFFNLIPECIGTDIEKYNTANQGMIDRAKSRFKKILQEERIQKVFLFTTKGWQNCPCTDEEERGKDRAPLGPDFEDITWGTYTIGRQKVLAYGFRHPQGAKKAYMTDGVRKALSMRVKGS